MDDFLILIRFRDMGVLSRLTHCISPDVCPDLIHYLRLGDCGAMVHYQQLGDCPALVHYRMMDNLAAYDSLFVSG